MESTAPIKLEIWKKLRDRPGYRRSFFRAEMRDQIASQIEAMREKRGLIKQIDFATACEMKQSAVSRIESSDYSSWTFRTLARVAEALDSRWTFELVPAESVIEQQRAIDESVDNESASVDDVTGYGSEFQTMSAVVGSEDDYLASELVAASQVGYATI